MHADNEFSQSRAETATVQYRTWTWAQPGSISEYWRMDSDGATGPIRNQNLGSHWKVSVNHNRTDRVWILSHKSSRFWKLFAWSFLLPWVLRCHLNSKGIASRWEWWVIKLTVKRPAFTYVLVNIFVDVAQNQWILCTRQLHAQPLSHTASSH